jgi:DNA-binding NtrC family response regulator
MQAQPKTVLYVESNPSTSLYYQLALQGQGFAVEVAGNAASLGASPVDAVILSQDPASAGQGSDAFRLAAEIKRQSPETPVVMVSTCESVVEDAWRFVDGAFWSRAPLAGLVGMLHGLTGRSLIRPILAISEVRVQALPAFVA